MTEEGLSSYVKTETTWTKETFKKIHSGAKEKRKSSTPERKARRYHTTAEEIETERRRRQRHNLSWLAWFGLTIADIQKELAVNIHRQHQRVIISDKILIEWFG